MTVTRTLRQAAYTVEALLDAGVPPTVVRTLVADGPRATPERALVSVEGCRRTKEPVTTYVWGPDAMALLHQEPVRTPRTTTSLPNGDDDMAAVKKIEIGLATWRALQTIYEVSRADLNDAHPDERALAQARIAFLDSAMVNKWKARIPMPTDPAVKALLAEDLAHQSAAGIDDDLEATHHEGQRQTLRLAFYNMAKKLGHTGARTKTTKK